MGELSDLISKLTGQPATPLGEEFTHTFTPRDPTPEELEELRQQNQEMTAFVEGLTPEERDRLRWTIEYDPEAGWCFNAYVAPASNRTESP